ncbi:hypothetical protein [Alicyclobacillus acidocaldarius]|uniref:Uncharacterized protein n=1 Tax=Alicyclobacillus acidocaldarius subsp. acidocaldarius (strain ATCC 27009 / DSM 446 / BCRC 14685 / JCM 5260 / KCTC 1825 / NBRC 15652 / NCIMB 11725 / NRRL B-14509 / 104-IA) TaxID=521098 RepID=C8WXF3_ALIAD|nr:hypothetical protein [Alicyclobacillus acidocaldarius]ACV57075.1 hypothetical protein Aaci_0010 [Alicyclobacillus acidocaldarius subsp. acidocaldarius DSM 446]
MAKAVAPGVEGGSAVKAETLEDVLRDPEFRRQYPPEFLKVLEDPKFGQEFQRFVEWAESLIDTKNIGKMSLDELAESVAKRLWGVVLTMFERQVIEMERAGRDVSHLRAWLARHGRFPEREDEEGDA